MVPGSEYVDELPATNEDLGRETIAAAQDATEREKAMGFLEGLKLYPKAALWSVMLSTAVVMEGFDVALLASLYGYPKFAQKYGRVGPDGKYFIPAGWEAALSNGSVVGEIIGLLINGFASERFGYRKTMLVSLTALLGLIFIAFFAPNVQVLLAYEVLVGIPFGIFQTLTTAYASEVCPVSLRAYLCTYVNCCWVLGQLLSSSVLRALLSNDTEWSYRIPFALQWIWPVPLIIGCYFAPESPWWLVRRRRVEDARRSLTRLTRKGPDQAAQVDRTISMIVYTDTLERNMSNGTSYRDCFRGVDRRRTEIACIAWAIQNLCGSAFMGFSVVLYKRAGLDDSHAFDLTMAQYGLGLLGAICSWFMMRRVGRRTIYLFGEVTMLAFLLVIGTVGATVHSPAGSWAVGSMLLAFTFIYDMTVGPVCYALVAEMSSTRLRAKTIVLARTVFNAIQIVNWVITPYQLGEDAWNWGAKTGFFWAGSVALCIVWTYFRLPEPRGRTYGELDVLFERRVPARLFSKTEVEDLKTLSRVMTRPRSPGAFKEETSFRSL